MEADDKKNEKMFKLTKKAPNILIREQFINYI